MRSPFARLGYTIALAVFAIDQLVKYWIVHVVELQRHGWVGLTSWLSLEWVANVGVSMSLLPATTDAMRWLLTVGTVAIAGLVAVWIARERVHSDVVALGLVLGGAAGNIVDRVRLGYVVDFVHVAYGSLDFRYVFNGADAAISVGVAMLLTRALLVRKGPAFAGLPIDNAGHER